LVAVVVVVDVAFDGFDGFDGAPGWVVEMVVVERCSGMEFSSVVGRWYCWFRRREEAVVMVVGLWAEEGVDMP
jgi:hypothetical protein